MIRGNSNSMVKSPIVFLGEVRSELEKVVWPTRAETIRLTVVVILVSVTVGLLISGLDITFTKVVELVVKR